MIPICKQKTDKTMMTLLSGTAKDDGCYYYVKNGIVYVHIAVKVNGNTDTKIFNMPTNLRPYNENSGVGTGADMTESAFCQIWASGDVMVRSGSGFVSLDMFYLLP